MTHRIEHDSLGNIEVPSDCLWGAQTQRSLNNFKIGSQLMPFQVIESLAIIKKASAIANNSMNLLSEEKKNLIIQVCDEIISGKHMAEFPLSVWQTGSGTQTNMNLNEVISNRAQELTERSITEKVKKLHPNDDVNMSQSSNDVFPAAMHLAAYTVLVNTTLPGLKQLAASLKKISNQHKRAVKVGRTHWMDATPITVGQEFSGYVALIESATRRIKNAASRLLFLPLGATAVGTGLNAPKGFDTTVCSEIATLTGFPFKPSLNKFEALSAHDALVEVHAALKQAAVSITKIANDIRYMASGPRCGLNELLLPENEPGSSIMPGKVNPTQVEAIGMVCCQIMGNDTAVTVAAMQGSFELNVYKPVIIKNTLESAVLLGDSCRSFAMHCVDGIRVNKDKLNYYLSQTLMLNTALSKVIGYEKAAQIAQIAIRENLGLKDAAIKSGFVSEADYNRFVDVNKMI